MEFFELTRNQVVNVYFTGDLRERKRERAREIGRMRGADRDRIHAVTNVFHGALV